LVAKDIRGDLFVDPNTGPFDLDLDLQRRPAMDDVSVDDEKKHFDVDGPHDDDALPDPDEQLMLDQGNGRVWLVKVGLDSPSVS
jgi:hypothetical protein